MSTRVRRVSRSPNRSRAIAPRYTFGEPRNDARLVVYEVLGAPLTTRGGTDLKKSILLLLAVVLLAGLAGCGGQSPEESEGGGTTAKETGDRGSTEGTGEEGTSAEDTGGDTTRPGAAQGGSTGGPNSELLSGVTLRIGGKPDLRFSGNCTVDGEERELGGRVPRTYTYEPQRRMSCKVSNRQRGTFRVSFSDGEGANAFQEVGPQPSTVELTYDGKNLSTTTRSIVRNSSRSSTQSSSRSSSQNSSQGGSQSSSQSNSSGVSSSQRSSQSSSSEVSPGEPGRSGGAGGAGGSIGAE